MSNTILSMFHQRDVGDIPSLSQLYTALGQIDLGYKQDVHITLQRPPYNRLHPEYPHTFVVDNEMFLSWSAFLQKHPYEKKGADALFQQHPSLEMLLNSIVGDCILYLSNETETHFCKSELLRIRAKSLLPSTNIIYSNLYETTWLMNYTTQWLSYVHTVVFTIFSVQKQPSQLTTLSSILPCFFPLHYTLLLPQNSCVGRVPDAFHRSFLKTYQPMKRKYILYEQSNLYEIEYEVYELISRFYIHIQEDFVRTQLNHNPIWNYQSFFQWILHTQLPVSFTDDDLYKITWFLAKLLAQGAQQTCSDIHFQAVLHLLAVPGKHLRPLRKDEQMQDMVFLTLKQYLQTTSDDTVYTRSRCWYYQQCIRGLKKSSPLKKDE